MPEIQNSPNDGHGGEGDTPLQPPYLESSYIARELYGRLSDIIEYVDRVLEQSGVGASLAHDLQHVKQAAQQARELINQHVPHPAPAGDAAAAPAALRGSGTILLVDDDTQSLQVCARILERYGYTVLAYSSPYEALQCSMEHDRPIDLVIADVMMPMMNGHELAARITAQRPATRALYISGYTADAVANYGVAAADRLIQKPFAAEMLARTVREALAG